MTLIQISALMMPNIPYLKTERWFRSIVGKLKASRNERGRFKCKDAAIMTNDRAAEVLEIAVAYNGCGRATSDELRVAVKMAQEALRRGVHEGKQAPCVASEMDWRG